MKWKRRRRRRIIRESFENSTRLNENLYDLCREDQIIDGDKKEWGGRRRRNNLRLVKSKVFSISQFDLQRKNIENLNKIK